MEKEEKYRRGSGDHKKDISQKIMDGKTQRTTKHVLKEKNEGQEILQDFEGGQLDIEFFYDRDKVDITKENLYPIEYSMNSMLEKLVEISELKTHCCIG